MTNPPDYWLFDLDNTVYPPSSGLFQAVDRRINLYLNRFLNVPNGRADEVRRGYFRQYGLTLVGLMREHDVDPVHYMDFVHRVNIEDYLGPDPGLRDLLGKIAAPKAIFTNGSREHARRVLEALGVSDQFPEIFDIASFDYVPKPDPLPYRKILEATGSAAADTILIDDLEQNLRPARELGMITVFVGDHGGTTVADYSCSTLTDLERILPDLLG